jgi:hypothetical protein
VELANALPLRSYPASRRPEFRLEYEPDVPAGILVADEDFDGGLGFGVVELGESVEFPFDVTHGGGSLRVALAWHDAPGELLVNNLDLEVIDGDFDRTPGWDDANTLGSGVCNTSAFSVGDRGDGVDEVSGYDFCGSCTIAGLPNPDNAYFDPAGDNPFVRRYLGNHFTDRQEFSAFSRCDSGTGLLDPAWAGSRPDTDNTTEMVYLYHTNPNLRLSPSQGTNSEGFYKAVVSFPDTGVQAGAPDTPCVVPASGSKTLDATVPGGNDQILTTRDGLEYIASGADDPNTAADEARCDTTASGTDVQLVSSGAIGQPFGLVVTGPIKHAGYARSQIALDRTAYDCSEASLVITVTEEETAFADFSSQIGAGTIVEVLDPNGQVVD